MMKAILVTLSLVLITGCGKSSSKKDLYSPQMETDAHGNPVFKTKIKMINFTLNEKSKIKKAADLIKKVMISKEFKQEVLYHEFNGKKAFANNRGLSNAEIYARILQASERLQPGKDSEMDVTLVAYYADAVTVGYTYPNSNHIWMNRKFFSRHDPAGVTTNIVHEWLHKLGFDHDASPTPERSYSVPYSIGYIVRKLARNYADFTVDDSIYEDEE